MRQQLERLLRPVRQRILGMVARAIIQTVKDDQKIQGVQVDVLKGESLEDVERFQEFGLSSHPPAGTEAVVLCVGGNRDHALVVATVHRDHRPNGLSEGESLLYDALGQVVFLQSGDGGDVQLGDEALEQGEEASGPRLFIKAENLRVEIAGDASIETKGKTKIKASGDVDVESGGNATVKANSGIAKLTGAQVQVTATSELSLTGSRVDISGDTKIQGKDFLDHTHSGVESGSDDTGDVN